MVGLFPHVFEGKQRGKLPTIWTIDYQNPVKMVYNYLYDTATENDYFAASDNGGEYIGITGMLLGNKDKRYARQTTKDGIEAFSKTA